MKILALICARGGSKRVPRKNIRELGGKPLIVWSIDLAAQLQDVVDTLVSTDDEAIAAVARAAGAYVPWLRPAELATDTTPTVDVALHALAYYESVHEPVDGVLLLQPTSPFRTVERILDGIEKFEKCNRRSVVGVSPASDHPLWCFRVDGDFMEPFIPGDGTRLRSQDLPPAFVVNGSFYLITPEQLKKDNTFLTTDSVPLISTDPVEAVDIDTEWDWHWAEQALEFKPPADRQ